jgi:hypothetical protein
MNHKAPTPCRCNWHVRTSDQLVPADEVSGTYALDGTMLLDKNGHPVPAVPGRWQDVEADQVWTWAEWFMVGFLAVLCAGWGMAAVYGIVTFIQGLTQALGLVWLSLGSLVGA